MCKPLFLSNKHTRNLISLHEPGIYTAAGEPTLSSTKYGSFRYLLSPGRKSIKVRAQDSDTRATESAIER